MRAASVSRRTAETDVAVSLALDGTGKAEIATGVGFLDHMLELFARHAPVRPRRSKVEGRPACRPAPHGRGYRHRARPGVRARRSATRRASRRYADVHLPMDETLTRVALDISGRPFLVFRTEFPREKIGAFDTELVREFFQAFAMNAGVTLHVETLYGDNSHHIAESCFKGLARALARRRSRSIRARRAACPRPRARSEGLDAHDDLHRCTSPPTPAPGDAEALERRRARARTASPGARSSFTVPVVLRSHRLWLAGLVVLVAARGARRSLAAAARRRRRGVSGRAAARAADRARGEQPAALDATRAQGWPAVDVVDGRRPRRRPRPRRFARWLGEAAAGRGAAPAAPAAPRPARGREPVIGLFPDAERRAMSVAIIDYGSGNLHSAAKAFERAAREAGIDDDDRRHLRSGGGRAGRPHRAARRRRLRRLPARPRRRAAAWSRR